MARRRYRQEGLEDIDWMKALKSTAGGLAGGIGGTFTGFFGIPIGVAGHVATEYFAESEDMDMIGKGISNGFIGGGFAGGVATLSAQNVSSQMLSSEELNFDTLTKYGSDSLSAQLMRPSVWLNEQLTMFSSATTESLSSATDLLTRDELEDMLDEYEIEGGFIE